MSSIKRSARSELFHLRGHDAQWTVQLDFRLQLWICNIDCGPRVACCRVSRRLKSNKAPIVISRDKRARCEGIEQMSRELRRCSSRGRSAKQHPTLQSSRFGASSTSQCCVDCCVWPLVSLSENRWHNGQRYPHNWPSGYSCGVPC